MVHFRKRSIPYLSLTVSATLAALNITLMVLWIVILAQQSWWSALAIGTVAFTLILVGLVLYVYLTIKERRLNLRQANFVDSVTHELKSPIASLRLYLETLRMRATSEEQREEFYATMEAELSRLDDLINELLEVARLDVIGQESAAEEVELRPLLETCAEVVLRRHARVGRELFSIEGEGKITASRVALEIIFTNLLDNALKYGGDPPRVHVSLTPGDKDRLLVTIMDNGPGIPVQERKRIFGLFYRGGDELQRRKKGTGLGLFIVHTLVRRIKGRISVRNREEGSGSVFAVELRQGTKR